MKVVLIRNSGEVIDMTQITGKFTIKGSAKECSRVLDIPFLRHKLDHYLPSVEVQLGDIVDITDNGAPVFKGVVWDIEVRDNDIEQRVTAYDYAVYLNKSNPKKAIYNETSGAGVAGGVISELGLKPGKLAKGIVDSYNGRDMTGYDLIMFAYTKAHKKNKKDYKLVAKGDEIHVFETGERHPVVLEELSEPLPGKLLNTSYRRSLDDLVNKVEVVEEKKKDKKDAKASNATSQNKYGMVQKIIRGEPADIPGTMKDAKIEVDVEAIADWDMITGLNMELKSTILAGDFYVISDTHTYDDGVHTVALRLSTEFEMYTKDEGGSKDGGDDTEVPSGTVGSMIEAGKAKIGSHYKWGHTGPNTFDCSGFVTYCAIQAGLMPPGSRLTSGTMPAQYVHKVSWSDLRPGDIVHYRGSPGHVAIYVGNGQVLECGGTSSSKLGYSGVAVTSMNARNHKFKNVYRFNKG